MESQSPHLPPRDRKSEEKMLLAIKRSVLGVVVIIVALLVGIIGGMLSGKYLSGVTVIENTPSIYVTQEANSVVNQIDKGVLNGVLPVYAKELPNSEILRSKFYIDQRDRLGTAVALTNDGWVLSTKDVIKNVQAVIGINDGKVAKIEKIVQDAKSDLVFAKLADTQLTAFAFAKITEETKTSPVAITTAGGPLRAIIINEVHHRECGSTNCLVQNARIHDEYGVASPYYKGVEKGMPLLNKGGEVLGLVTGTNPQDNSVEFISSSLISPVLEDLFATGKVRRVELPITYVALSNYRSSDPEMQNDGALVVTIEAKKVGEVGLMVNDVIIAVNGVPVTKDQTLSGLLYSYPVGTTIQLKVLRKGEEITVDVPLPAQE